LNSHITLAAEPSLPRSARKMVVISGIMRMARLLLSLIHLLLVFLKELPRPKLPKNRFLECDTGRVSFCI
jgi:hypothetical protein